MQQGAAEQEQSELISNYFRGRIQYLESFSAGLVAPIERSGSAGSEFFQGTLTVEALKERLAQMKASGDVLRSPVLVTVLGTFLPCVLLSAGWWERRQGSRSVELRWRDPVQEWLFQGFDLWAPSWDLSLTPGADSADGGHLLGQIGTLDEADSLPVLIHGQKAKEVRSASVSGYSIVLKVAVRGLLTHVGHLLPSESAALGPLHSDEGGSDYCLVVREDDAQHELSLRFGSPDLYSGYLWQCWASREALGSGPQLNDAYFVWEHTNLSNAEAVKYNLEALEFKVQRLLPRMDAPILLQKSHSVLVPGAPFLSTKQFYELLVAASGSGLTRSRTS